MCWGQWDAMRKHFLSSSLNTLFLFFRFFLSARLDGTIQIYTTLRKLRGSVSSSDGRSADLRAGMPQWITLLSQQTCAPAGQTIHLSLHPWFLYHCTCSSFNTCQFSLFPLRLKVLLNSSCSLWLPSRTRKVPSPATVGLAVTQD